MEIIKLDKVLLESIREILQTRRTNAISYVNKEQLFANFEIGKLIVENEGTYKERYGTSYLLNLSKMLTKEFGRGFSRTNIHYMRAFYLNYEKSFQPVAENSLSWKHYCELLDVSDKNARDFYEKETINSKWSANELSRQINSSLFERLLLASNNDNKKEQIYKLSQSGQVVKQAQDIIKEPYIFEFLGLSERAQVKESKLEKLLIEKLKDFLLELGRGFMFVGNQQRITLGNRHHHVDLVFYNKIIKAYVLIDLKTGKFKHENIGQMNTYLNYYEAEINDDSDTKPIGIILCADKNEIEVEYAMVGVNSNIFASKYSLVLPDKELLAQKLITAVKR